MSILNENYPGKSTIYLGFREYDASFIEMGVEEAQAEIRCQKKVTWYLCPGSTSYNMKILVLINLY